MSRFSYGPWITALDLIVADGKGYQSWTDVDEGDGDIPHGSLMVLEAGGPQEGTDILYWDSKPDYHQLQEADGWIYF